jgi:hypothetical protein
MNIFLTCDLSFSDTPPMGRAHDYHFSRADGVRGVHGVRGFHGDGGVRTSRPASGGFSRHTQMNSEVNDVNASWGSWVMGNVISEFLIKTI